MNKLKLYWLTFIFFFICLQFKGQSLYYKSLNDSILNTFNKDTCRVVINENDELYKYKNYFNYVLCLYPKITYKRLYISSKKSNKISHLKTKLLSIISTPEDRNYFIYFSKKAESTLDTVSFFNLTTDSKIALISKQISMVEVCGNSGFFDMIGLYFKKRSIKRSKDLNKDINLKSIEAGLGYQLLDYTLEVKEKLDFENWADKKLHKKYYLKNTYHLMEYDAIKTYMYDYPVYLQNNYK